MAPASGMNSRSLNIKLSAVSSEKVDDRWESSEGGTDGSARRNRDLGVGEGVGTPLFFELTSGNSECGFEPHLKGLATAHAPRERVQIIIQCSAIFAYASHDWVKVIQGIYSGLKVGT